MLALMNRTTDQKLNPHSEEFLHTLMRRQLRLSLACATAFLLVLLGLPLANYFLPDLMATSAAGFSLSWMILGIGFFPAVWVIAWVFISRSMALEEQEVREVAAGYRATERQSTSTEIREGPTPCPLAGSATPQLPPARSHAI